MSGASNDRFFTNTSYHSTDVFNNQVVRLVVLGSVGGNQVRIRLSNEFGTVPLLVSAAHIALSDTGANILAGTDRTLTFNGGSPYILTSPRARPRSATRWIWPCRRGRLLSVSLYLRHDDHRDHGAPQRLQDHTYVSPAGSGDVTAATVSLPLDAADSHDPAMAAAQRGGSARQADAAPSWPSAPPSPTAPFRRWTPTTAGRITFPSALSATACRSASSTPAVVANPLQGNGNGSQRAGPPRAATCWPGPGRQPTCSSTT